MNQKYQLLQQLINDSNTILIASHISPDLDAITSTIFLVRTLRLKFPEKKVIGFNENPIPQAYKFILNENDINVTDFNSLLRDSNPDLLIIVDVNSLERVTQGDVTKTKELLTNTKTVVIDHHKTESSFKPDVFIDKYGSASVAEALYQIFIEDLHYPIAESIPNVLMLGILDDTNRFLYENPNHRTTFKVASELIDKGANIELLTTNYQNYTVDQLLVITELLKNFTQEKEFNYSFITDEFVQSIINKIDYEQFSPAYHFVLEHFIRSTHPNKWGFVLVPDLQIANLYRLSFRSINGYVDTTVFTTLLGGGGHKLASGARIKANSFQDALDIVLGVIRNNANKAKINE